MNIAIAHKQNSLRNIRRKVLIQTSNGKMTKLKVIGTNYFWPPIIRVRNQIDSLILQWSNDGWAIFDMRHAFLDFSSEKIS